MPIQDHPWRLRTGVLALAILALTTAFAAYGLVHSDLYRHSIWTQGGAKRLALLSAAFWSIFAILYASGRTEMPRRLAYLFVLAAVISAGVAAVAGALFVLASAYAIGERIVPSAASQKGDGVVVTLRFAAGLAVLGWVLALLVPFPVNNAFTWLLLLGVPCALNARALGTLARSAIGYRREFRPMPEVLLLGALGNICTLLLVAALLPEIAWDSLALHLEAGARIQQLGYWPFDVTRNYLSVLPMAGDFLYAAAYMFGGEESARLLNLAIFALTSLLVYRTLRATVAPWVALVAVLIVVSSPLAVMEGASLLIENPWSFLVVGAVVAALRMYENGARSDLYLTALLFGAATATKTIALALTPGLLVVLVLASRRWPETLRIRTMALATIVAAVAAAPPYVTAFVKTGNPVFPFFNAIFKSPLYFSDRNFANALFPATFDPFILYGFTFAGNRFLEAYNGAMGIAPFLLFPVTLVVAILGNANSRLVALFVTSFALVVVGGTAYIRYFYPLLFLLALLVGWAIERLHQSSPRIARGFAGFSIAACAAAVPLLPAAASVQLGDLPLSALVDGPARRAYLRQAASTRGAIDYLNAIEEQVATVALLGAPFTAGLRPGFVSYSWYMAPLHVAMDQDHTNAMSLLLEREANYFVVDEITPPWLVAEVARVASREYQFGTSSVYKLNPKMRFMRELLTDTSPSPASPHWRTFGHPTLETAGGETRVTFDDFLYQIVPVTGGSSYLLAQESRCGAVPRALRLQVNWLAADGEMISVVLVPRNCSPQLREETLEVRAPAHATRAVVYAVGIDHHDPVLIRSVSLRAN